MSGTATGPRPSPGKEYVLVPHPAALPSVVTAVRVQIMFEHDALLLTFIVDGNAHVALPDRATSMRADELWQTTCCELFLAPVGQDRYFEFNYSPSTRWNAYRFDGYRRGMCDLPLSVPPHIERGDGQGEYLIDVGQDLGDLPSTELAMGLSAVIEETDGTKSYWALAHAPGPPDFHNRDCFIATLPPPPPLRSRAARRPHPR